MLNDSDRILALDGLRGIAITGVLLAHSLPGLAPWLGSGILWADIGSFGVDLFFVLSGFLITRNLLQHKTSSTYFPLFYGNRFLRLFPVYYVYLAILAFLIAPLHHLAGTSMPDFTGSWWWYIFYFCNWKVNRAASDPYLGHFWSLAIEEQFYLVWPFIIWLLSDRKALTFCGVLAALSFSLRFIGSINGADWNTLYRLTFFRLEPLAFGSILAITMNHHPWRKRVASLAPSLAIAGVFGLLATSIWAGGPQWTRTPVQTLGALFAAIGFAGLVGVAVRGQSGVFLRALEARPLITLGRYSYCMYVIHVLLFAHVTWVAAYLAKHLPAYAGVLHGIGLAVGMILVFLVARTSWQIFESPILTNGKRRLREALGLVVEPGPVRFVG